MHGVGVLHSDRVPPLHPLETEFTYRRPRILQEARLVSRVRSAPRDDLCAIERSYLGLVGFDDEIESVRIT